MMEFAAPYPAIQTISLMPNPQFSDTEALTASVSPKRATDGTLYTYVKTKNRRRKMTWTLQLSRPHALELRAFLLAYFASTIRIKDHNDRIWAGYFTNNPFEFETPSRSGPTTPSGLRGETQTITLEFEGVEISKHARASSVVELSETLFLNKVLNLAGGSQLSLAQSAIPTRVLPRSADSTTEELTSAANQNRVTLRYADDVLALLQSADIQYIANIMLTIAQDATVEYVGAQYRVSADGSQSRHTVDNDPRIII